MANNRDFIIQEDHSRYEQENVIDEFHTKVCKPNNEESLCILGLYGKKKKKKKQEKTERF